MMVPQFANIGTFREVAITMTMAIMIEMIMKKKRVMTRWSLSWQLLVPLGTMSMILMKIVLMITMKMKI